MQIIADTLWFSSLSLRMAAKTTCTQGFEHVFMSLCNSRVHKSFRRKRPTGPKTPLPGSEHHCFGLCICVLGKAENELRSSCQITLRKDHKQKIFNQFIIEQTTYCPILWSIERLGLVWHTKTRWNSFDKTLGHSPAAGRSPLVGPSSPFSVVGILALKLG